MKTIDRNLEKSLKTLLKSADDFYSSETWKNRMIDYLEDCDPVIRNLAYINLMIA